MELKAILPKGKVFSTVNAQMITHELSNFGFELQGKMSEYPPAPAGSKYVRTGFLGMSWNKSGPATVGNSIMVAVGNIMEYAPLVQDEERQKSFHKAHGWKTIQVVGKELWEGKYKPRIRQILRMK